MNINTTLSGYFKENELIVEAEINKEILNFFNERKSVAKYKYATKIIKMIVEKIGKEKLNPIITELYKVENATMRITKNRDHVIHSCNTFLLGLCINKYYLNDKVDFFEWALAALFHDIAYPVKISQDIIGSYLENMSTIHKDLDIESSLPVINLIPKYFEKLTNNKNAFECLQKRIDKWELNVNVQNRYDERNLCHGMLSALTILYLIDLMYKKNLWWIQDNFEKHIVPACSAIFLHNLEADAFDNIKINKAPLPYLLKLCDELQIWERPKNKMPRGDSPENCDIEINENEIIFIVKNEDVRKEIEEKIKCLNNDKKIKLNGHSNNDFMM